MNQNISDHILEVMMHMRSLTHRLAVSEGSMSFIKVAVLHYIQETKKPTMKDIASFLQITMPSASVLVADLVLLRLVRRVPDIKDRRVVRVFITPQGEKMMKKQLSIAQKTIRNHIQTLSVVEQKQLLKILKKLHQNISII